MDIPSFLCGSGNCGGFFCRIEKEILQKNSLIPYKFTKNNAMDFGKIGIFVRNINFEMYCT